MDIRNLVTVDATSMHVHRVNLDTAAHSDDAANALRYVGAAFLDEPLFVIRGRDALAVPVLGAYLEECNRHRLYAMARQVDAHAGRFIAWQGAEAKLTRLPDPWPGWPKCAGDTPNDQEQPNAQTR